MPQRLLSYMEDRRTDMVNLLTTLVNHDSPSSDKALVDQLALIVEEQARALGAAVERFPEEKYGDHLLLRWGTPSPDGPRPVLLLAHIDTVWPAGEAGRRPARLEGDRLFGPGSFDMKAGFVQGLFAVRALLETGSDLPRPVMFLVTSDEEVGSPSSRPLIERLAREASAALVLEPASHGGALKTARKGIAMYHLTVTGRAAHAGIEPGRGVSAVLELAHQIIALHGMNDLSNGISVTVGRASGGTRTNVVPAGAEAYVDVRALTAADLERLDKAIRSLRPRLEGTDVQVTGGVNRPPLERRESTVALFLKAREAARGLGFDIEESTTGGGSDGNFTAALGVPTLDGLGAVGDGAHGLGEHVVVSEMPRRAAMLARLLELMG